MFLRSNLRFVRGGLAASASAGAGVCLARTFSDQLASTLSRLLHNARYGAVSRWSFWLGAERWLQALVLILDRPASSFVDTYDAAHT